MSPTESVFGPGHRSKHDLLTEADGGDIMETLPGEEPEKVSDGGMETELDEKWEDPFTEQMEIDPGQMDINFGEDASRLQRRRGAENCAVLRRIALSLLKQHSAKMSIACKRIAAAADTDFLEEILKVGGNPEKP